VLLSWHNKCLLEKIKMISSAEKKDVTLFWDLGLPLPCLANWPKLRCQVQEAHTLKNWCSRSWLVLKVKMPLRKLPKRTPVAHRLLPNPTETL